MDSPELRAPLFTRTARGLRPFLAALTTSVLATSVLVSTAAAQPAPGEPPPPFLQAPAPWRAPPPPACGDLPWVWGFPLPQNGPVWYLAPDAPTLSGKPAPKPGEPPKRPLTKRDSLKRGLILAGAIGLGAATVGSVFAYSSAAGKYGFGSGWETMLIPAVGPFIAAGVAEGVQDPSSTGQVPLLIALGGLETTFAALLFTGLGLSPGKQPARDTAPAPEAQSPGPPPLVIAPSVSSSGGGLSVGGVF